MAESENLNTFQAKRENVNKVLKLRFSAGILAFGICLVMSGFYLVGVDKLAAGLVLIGIGVFIIGVRYG